MEIQKRQTRQDILTFRLILPKQQDSDGPSMTHLRNIPRRFVITIAIVVIVAISPKTTYGGFFSIFSKLGTNTEIKEGLSLDTVPLLESSMSADTNPARGGGDILLEDGSALVATTGGEYGENPAILRSQNGHISVYEVREGDALSQIAEMFGVSVNTIRWANDLEGGALTPGQTLVILPVTGLKYTVQKGDTLASVAKKYNANAQEIADFNGVSGGNLVIGSEIIIPDAEPTAPKKTSTTKKSSGSSGKSGVNTSGYFKWPVAGGTRTQGIHGYNAIDIGAAIGTPIYAAAGGTVIVARSGSWNGGYGNYVVIKHGNGTQTLYAHADSLTVSSGEAVSQGDLIGYVGNTGKSTGPHLHFEVRGGVNPF